MCPALGPLLQERLAALAGQVVDHVAAGHRPERGHGRVVEHQRLVLRDHQHDQQVVDLRQRDERGIQRRDGEESRAAEGQRGSVEPGEKSAHESLMVARRGSCDDPVLEHRPERERHAAPARPLDPLPHVARARGNRVQPFMAGLTGQHQGAAVVRGRSARSMSARFRDSSITQLEPRLIETIASSKASSSMWARMPVPAGYPLTTIWSGADGIRPSRTSDTVRAFTQDGRSPMRKMPPRVW